MKKSLPFFVLLCIVYSNLFSQINQYKPFPQTNGTWEIRHWGPLGPGLPGYTTHVRYTVQGDTTIGAFSYKKVVSANSPIQTGPTYSFGPDSFSFAYRNDIVTKKVYRNLGINHDTLWYDFNLNVGDTIKNNFSNNSHNTIIVFEKIVQSIDSVLICGTYYKNLFIVVVIMKGTLLKA